MNTKVLFFKFALIIAMLSIAGCGGAVTSNSSPSLDVEPTTVASTATPVLAITTPMEEPVIVAFAKDGDLHVWDSVSKQSHVVLKAGDVTNVMMSGDGQVIAFIRRSLSFEPLLVEHNALWAVNSNGENPRELISDETLRQMLNPPAEDSAGFAQISWIPGTHRLVYSAVKFHAPGQGFTNSKDIYVVDVDTGSNAVLAADIMPDAFINAWRFVLSPDSQQIALFTNTELSFINIDGSNWRKAVLTYPAVGAGDAVLLPNGIWTQDSRAFIFTGPIQSDSMFVLNYTIWRVPVDGSPTQPLATLTESHSGSITFSSDGKQMAFFQDMNGDGVIQEEDYLIMPLAVEAGPLAIPYTSEWGAHSNPHWSPAGTAFVIKDQELLQLCPDATHASEVCGDPIHMKSDSNIISASIQWVDSTRFLFTGLEPSTLSLGNLDGTILPIVTWTNNDALPGWSFYKPH